jgi:hypothetical protein
MPPGPRPGPPFRILRNDARLWARTVSPDLAECVGPRPRTPDARGHPAGRRTNIGPAGFAAPAASGNLLSGADCSASRKNCPAWNLARCGFSARRNLKQEPMLRCKRAYYNRVRGRPTDRAAGNPRDARPIAKTMGSTATVAYNQVSDSADRLPEAESPGMHKEIDYSYEI